MVNRSITMSRKRGAWWQERLGLRLTPAIAVATLLVAAAAPARAATVSVVAKAQVIKPLILTSKQNFELGSLVLKPGTWTATVKLSRTGVLTCPATITCTGATSVAQYNVSGTNNQVVTLTTPNVVMVNQADATKKLTLVIDSPGTVTLTSSGPPGTDFPLGGSIAIASTTADGDYVGTFNVSADYQ